MAGIRYMKFNNIKPINGSTQVPRRQESCITKEVHYLG